MVINQDLEMWAIPWEPKILEVFDNPVPFIYQHDKTGSNSQKLELFLNDYGAIYIPQMCT